MNCVFDSARMFETEKEKLEIRKDDPWNGKNGHSTNLGLTNEHTHKESKSKHKKFGETAGP